MGNTKEVGGVRDALPMLEDLKVRSAGVEEGKERYYHTEVSPDSRFCPSLTSLQILGLHLVHPQGKYLYTTFAKRWI